jgi:lactoylglutathione lyase
MVAMRLAKNHVDIGLFTNRLEPMLAFWQREVGLAFEEILPVGGGVHQHRHSMNGSVLKINHVRDPLADAPPSGYRALTIARADQAGVKTLVDPDGNVVTLVAPGTDGVTGIAVDLAVRDGAAFDDFYARALGLERAGERAWRAGDTLLRWRAEPGIPLAGDSMRARGYRYLTVQVFDCDAVHAAVLAAGGREGSAPRTLGSVARISFVRDPDGNWIEISQRASLVGAIG